MERAVFGASEFFSQNAFMTGLRGIENVIIGQPRGTDIDIVEIGIILGRFLMRNYWNYSLTCMIQHLKKVRPSIINH